MVDYWKAGGAKSGKVRDLYPISEENFELLIEQASDGIFISDSRHQYIQVNSSACRMSGYSRAQLLQMGIADISMIHITDRDRFNTIISALLHGETLIFEDCLKRADGTLLPVEVSTKLLPDGRVQAFIRDIYERKLAEEHLRQSEMQFRLLADTTPNIVISTDLKGSVLFTNERWHSYTGQTENQTQDWLTAVHPEDAPELRTHYENALARGSEFSREFRLRRKDGSYRWFLGRLRAQQTQSDKSPLLDDTLQRRVASLTDIHDQKLLEHAYQERAITLEYQRKWLEELLSKIPTPILLVGREGEVIFANRASDAILGQPHADEVVKQQMFFYPSGTPLTKIEELPHARLARGERLDRLELIFKNGPRTYNLLFFGEMVPALHGQPETYVLSFQDITPIKKAAEQLQRSNFDLELFASIASHDLREPLRTISSYVKLFASRYQGTLDKDADVYIEFLVDATSRMKSLIDQTLEYARSGKSVSAPVEVNCGEILRKVLENLQIAISEKKATITSTKLPTIRGYPTQLEQLFQNLISNAIKFNQNPTPQVDISFSEHDVYFLFSVKDNGIGIAAEDQLKIFEPFKRVYSRNEYSGTGLGLAVCKRIVDAHSGKLWVNSQPGEGSTFFFTIARDLSGNRLD